MAPNANFYDISICQILNISYTLMKMYLDRKILMQI